MTLDFLMLQSFRSYADINLELGSGFNFITGANGTGKTSLLEAASVILSGYSFRKTSDRYLASQKSPSYYLGGRISHQQGSSRIEISYHRQKGRRILIDKKKVASFKELMMLFPFLSFEPEDKDMITGEPELRRRFFDRMISYLEPSYYDELIRYQKLLKQRNQLLKEKAFQNMDFWETELSLSAQKIAGRRGVYLDIFNQALKKAKLPIGAEGVFFLYKKNYQEDLSLTLKKDRPVDTRLGFTKAGPHRDDFLLQFPLGVVKHFASQGQIKTLSFYIKLIGAQIFAQRLKKKPILLIDDIFAELDSSNRKKILLGLEELETQVLITAVNKDSLTPLFQKKFFSFQTQLGGSIQKGEEN